MNVLNLIHLALPAAEPAARVGSGTISGGWGYVWASWGITWGMMIGYGLYLWMRRPGDNSRNEG